MRMSLYKDRGYASMGPNGYSACLFESPMLISLKSVSTSSTRIEPCLSLYLQSSWHFSICCGRGRGRGRSVAQPPHAP